MVGCDVDVWMLLLVLLWEGGVYTRFRLIDEWSRLVEQRAAIRLGACLVDSRAETISDRVSGRKPLE